MRRPVFILAALLEASGSASWEQRMKLGEKRERDMAIGHKESNMEREGQSECDTQRGLSEHQRRQRDPTRKAVRV